MLRAASYEDSQLVFATSKGAPLDAQNVVNMSFKPLLAEAGLRPIRFHDLRYTCATLMLSQGMNPKITQEQLGHATIAQTMNTYSHDLPDMQDQNAAALETAMS